MTEQTKPTFHLNDLGTEPRARLGLEAVERAMREPPTAIEVALYVNGRLVTTKTDSETVFRVLGILTGLDR